MLSAIDDSTTSFDRVKSSSGSSSSGQQSQLKYVEVNIYVYKRY
jgi:hypothetical protein